MLGCSVSHAIAVETILNQGNKKLRDIADVTYPWSCLVCCRGFSPKRGKKELPSRAFDFLKGAFRYHIRKTDFKLPKKGEFILKEAPSYVYRILEGERLSERDWDEIRVNKVTVVYEKEDHPREEFSKNSTRLLRRSPPCAAMD